MSGSRGISVSRRGVLLSCLLVLLVLAGAGIAVLVHRANEPAPVRTRDLFIPVVDGPQHNEHISLDATVYYPPRTPAPALLVSPGFGDTKTALDAESREFARRGFVVLAYTPRGFGHSGGLIALNSPDYEVADARQLIDWLGRQSEVVRDGPDDPRVAVTGGSYGGALSLMVAGTDRRVRAIAPVITYNDLSQALIPNAATTGLVDTATPAAGAFGGNGVFKRSWAGMFFADGMTGGQTSTPRSDAPEPGSTSTPSPNPATPKPHPPGGTTGCGRFLPEVCAAYQELATTGVASQQTIDLLRRNSPVSVTSHIRIPTLLVQGEQDSLFGLDQADANARQITRAGGKVSMIWYDGGHDGGGPGPDLRAQIADWLSYQLTHVGPDPDIGFQYSVQGAYRANGTPNVRTVTAPAYPGLGADTPAQRQTLRLAGAADQEVLNPAGGSPAALSGLPGVTGALGPAAGSLATEVPGEFASWATAPLSSQLQIAGSATVRLRVGSVPGQPSNGQAVLFAKLYDVAPDGSHTLPDSLVAPIRIDPLPADGTPVTVTVTLPGIVQPVQAGHRVQLVVSTTDQSYANLTQPAVLRISLDGGQLGDLAVPLVPGTTTSTPLPVGQLVGIGLVLLAIGLVAWYLIWRRRHADDDFDPALAGVPLVLSGLGKAYSRTVIAVDDLSFRVEPGQVVGLLGPNGAGKTTALRMMLGLITPSAGQVRIFGHRIRPGAPVLSRIGSFVEGAGFLPHLSGLANLRLYWQATGRPDESARFDEALEIAGLGDAVRRRVGTYSQGMRQRLAIAQAMLGLPDLLVLDEPTNGLDPPQIRDMRDVLRRYAAGGRTVLVSSHLLTEVEQTCTHVVVMHKGKLVAAGEVADIMSGSGETSFRVDDAERAVKVLRDLDGITQVSDVDIERGVVHAELNGTPRSEAVGALVRAGIAVDQVGPRGRLEDAFLQLVGGERT